MLWEQNQMRNPLLQKVGDVVLQDTMDREERSSRKEAQNYLRSHAPIVNFMSLKKTQTEGTTRSSHLISPPVYHTVLNSI